MSRRKKPFFADPTRRRFLQGVGLGAAAFGGLIPMLESDVKAGGAYPKRLILMFTPDGANTEDWRPSSPGKDFTLSTILSPLEEMRDRILICDGLRGSMDGAGQEHAHGMAGLWTGSRAKEGTQFDGGNNVLTGWGEGTSIDQRIADLSEGQTPYRSLEFGVQPGAPTIVSRMIYGAPESPISPEKSPYSMFDALYGDLGASQAELIRIRARKQSVLDTLGSRLKALQSKVAAHDRHKIDTHLTSIREIEKRLDNSVGDCEVPMIGGEIDVDANDNFDAVGDLQMQLMAASIACDVTRVASLQWSEGFSVVYHRWINKTENHHSYSHGNGLSNNTDIDRWYATQFLRLLQLLDQYPEGDGTVLDNTLIAWGRELGTPHHVKEPIPLVLAGGASGAIEMGRYMDFGGMPHAALLVSICQAMGLPGVESYGEIDINTGTLPGLLA